MRERAVAAFHGGFMMQAPLQLCLSTDPFRAFMEVVDQCGAGMKPSTYHEVDYLTKEVEETKINCGGSSR